MKEVNKALLESLFYKGHEYREILHILRTRHHINICLRTLQRRLKQYSFQRNGVEFCPGSLRDALMESLMVQRVPLATEVFGMLYSGREYVFPGA